ncbi:hypothetical protein J2128_002186 [Methanomicrobium sp. W14]|nr:hypothetical protein [Methanomicrobium sp. W14]
MLFKLLFCAVYVAIQKYIYKNLMRLTSENEIKQTDLTGIKPENLDKSLHRQKREAC